MDSSLREPLVNAGASSAARAHASAADRDDRASSVDAGRAASAREPLVDAEDGGEAGARNGASSPSSSSSHGHLKLLFLLASLSGSAWGRFGQLFYLEKGLSTVQIGAIEGLMPLVGVVAASGWAVVADKARSRKTVYLLTTTLSTITLLLLAWSALVQRSFVRILAVSIAYRFFTSSGILDAYALGCLGDNGAAYGRLRLFGSIGWGGGALIMGAINHRWGFSPNFVIFGTTNALLVFALAHYVPADVGHGGDAPRRPATRELLKTLRSRPLAMFLGEMFIFGMAVGIVERLLFVYVVDVLGGSSLLCGWVVFVSSMTNIPVFQNSALLLKRIGREGLMIVAYACYFVRVFGYTYLRPETRWWILALETLHGCTFATLWIASVAARYPTAGSGRTRISPKSRRVVQDRA